MQTADCRLQIGLELQTKYKMKTVCILKPIYTTLIFTNAVTLLQFYFENNGNYGIVMM